MGECQKSLWRAQRFTYALVGLCGASLFTLGLLLVRAGESVGVLSAAALWAELLSETVTYGYVTVGTLLMSVGVGWVVGQKAEHLEALSLTCPLTHLPNRRAFGQAMTRELLRARRYQSALALMVVDVDRFKQINDAYGHHVGDAALRLVAKSLQSSCRATDLPARLGGDEFVVLAPLTTAAEALGLATRVREKLAALCHGSPTLAALSVSIGVADLGCVVAPRASAAGAGLAGYWGDALLGAADAALYAAKEAGRDCAHLAQPQREGEGEGVLPPPQRLEPTSPRAMD